MGILPACVCALRMRLVPAEDPLRLELQPVVSHPVGAGDRTQVL